MLYPNRVAACAVSKLAVHDIPTGFTMYQSVIPSFKRRALLRAMFLGAGATALPFLSACSSDSDVSTSTAMPTGPNENGNPPVVNPPNLGPLAMELPLQAGPLAGIGELVTTGVDNIFAPAGFTVRPAVNGKMGLNMEQGKLQVLEIVGFEAGAYQEDIAVAQRVHRVKWVDVLEPENPQAEVRTRTAAAGLPVPGTVFRGGEGIWIQEFPQGQAPAVSGVAKPMRAVAFFACKGDNRVYALDIDNDLIEVVFDNSQLAEGTGFDDVDNLVISPAGDVIVAEDGDAMRLMVMIPNQPAKILLQITGGGS